MHIRKVSYGLLYTIIVQYSIDDDECAHKSVLYDGSDKSRCCCSCCLLLLLLLGCCLTAEAVQGATLTLEGVHDVHGRDRLALGVFGVGDGVADDVLEEDLEHAARLLVDEARDTLDTASTSETTDGGLSDALDVVAQHLPVTLGATLSQTFASFTASRHGYSITAECANATAIITRTTRAARLYSPYTAYVQ
jgi:hypothetical protein